MTKEEVQILLTRSGFRGILGWEGDTIHLHINPHWPPQVWDALRKLAEAGYSIAWEAGVMKGNARWTF